MSMKARSGSSGSAANPPDPALQARGGEQLGEIGALECLGVIALPDVVVALRIERQVEPAFVVEHGGKPRIVAPVRVDHDRAGRLPGAQEVVDGVGFPARIPRRPQFRALGADGRAQQRQAARRQRLGFLDPGDPESLQRLDRFGGVVLHALEDDQAVAGGCDPVAVDPELRTDAEGGDLALDQALAGLRQRLLDFADADRERAPGRLAFFDQKLAEKMRLSRSATAEGALVAGRPQQRLENPSCLNFQDRQ